MDSEKRSNSSQAQGQGEKKVSEIKPSPAAKNSLPVSIPLAMISKKDQLDSTMKNNHALLGKHKLPCAPPPQRQPVQSHVKPKPKPLVIDHKAVQTDQTYNIKPSEMNLISYIREKNITSFKVMSIIDENLAKQDKPAIVPTAVNQNGDNDNNQALQKQLEDLSNFNKKQLLSIFNFGVNAGKLFGHELKLAQTNPTPNPSASAQTENSKQTNNETEPTEEDKIRKQVTSDVMNTLRELIKSGVINMNYRKTANRLTPDLVAQTTAVQKQKRPPVPLLNKIRAMHKQRYNPTAALPRMPSYTEAPMQRMWPMIPATQMPVTSYNQPYATVNEGNFVNAMSHGTRQADTNTNNKVHSPPNHSRLQVPYHTGRTIPVPMGQQYAPAECQPIIDVEYQRVQELQNFHYMKETHAYQNAVQQQQRDSYPNTQWSNFQRKN